MKAFYGVCGSGDIARDPWDPGGWSGISARFFRACQGRGLLADALGFEISPVSRAIFLAKNFDVRRSVWRQKFYMDVAYRDALTRRICEGLQGRDARDILQLGAMYDSSPALAAGRHAFSYHDGNFSCSVRSPHFPREISSSRIDATLEYERGVAHRMKRIFTMSDYLRRSFIDDYGVPEGNVVNIGAGINLDSFPEPTSDKNYDLKEILFIGIDFERKGGWDVLRAFQVIRERHPKAILHVVGPRREPPREAMVDGVQWHGYLSKSNEDEGRRLSALLDSATLFLMPSLYEPFGIAPLEAMSHGIPAVVSDRWALPEIVVEGRHGANVAPGDWKELAEVVSDLLDDPAKLRRYGTAGREHVLENFTWERVVARLEEALEDVYGSS